MRTDDEILKHVSYWMPKGKECSPLGLRVLRLLEELDGLHHMEDARMRKVDWTDGYRIRVLNRSGRSFATFDGNALTRLVFLAHDHCLRVSVNACNPQFMEILFHGRIREGAWADRHPTLEEAVAEHRKQVLVYDQHR